MTKIKQMLCAKYWFTSMNHLIGQTIKLFWLSSISTKSHKQAKSPLSKPSVMPEEPWEQISIDFGGPSTLVLECKESHFCSLPILDGKLKLSIYLPKSQPSP